MTARKRTLEKNREIRHAMYGENAKLAIGELTHGCEIYGLTKGDISIVNIIEEILKQTGKADVTCATWAAAGYDIKKLKVLQNSEYINNINFILDYSAESKLGTDRFAVMRETFPNNVYTTKIHAKFITIKNDEWNICVRTSMNLNENKRMENFEISDCEVLYEYMNNIAQDIISMGSYDSKNFDVLGRDEKYPKIKRVEEKTDYSGVTLF